MHGFVFEVDYSVVFIFLYSISVKKSHEKKKQKTNKQKKNKQTKEKKNEENIKRLTGIKII